MEFIPVFTEPPLKSLLFVYTVHLPSTIVGSHLFFIVPSRTFM